MSNYIASDTDLTAVADAIRTKGGTSGVLEFPNGFVNAIGAISAGGAATLVGSAEFVVSTTSTSDTKVGDITLDNDKVNDESIIVIVIRDKAGKRSGYLLGSINVSIGGVGMTRHIAYEKNGSIMIDNMAFATGIYSNAPSINTSPKTATIRAKYQSSYGTIDGTFLCEVYAINQFVGAFNGNPIT